MKDANATRSLEAYPSRTSADIRYSDLDRQGHVNNAVFATFSEVGRVAFMYDPARPLASEGRSFVIARLLIDFRAELFWPGTVEIGTGVVRVGRSSFTLAQGMFSDGRLVATTEATIVMVDKETRRSTPLPPVTLDILQSLMLADASRE
ncbi:acyl-CoA thioesterase [Microvirga aerilata]|jgi:acyl-CoA thioester hydrolase|uniref:Acyl-CoA thioesterase n=1 Tax=Microvirga aerilata TaxID=670292 RepID=A0A936ZA17_9HYPH|nr:thioesterase family protein [Microvirga aerilata]MBL0406731.1 acyl-CoA thioesterase [Microvirga aerilata]